jgi:hypothetical protein
MNFDGVDDSILIPNSPSLNLSRVTIVAIVNPNYSPSSLLMNY